MINKDLNKIGLVLNTIKNSQDNSQNLFEFVDHWERGSINTTELQPLVHDIYNKYPQAHWKGKAYRGINSEDVAYDTEWVSWTPIHEEAQFYGPTIISADISGLSLSKIYNIFYEKAQQREYN